MTHSLLRSLIRETLLTEEVYGAQAIVYHGTNADPQALVSALLNDEFIPGRGAGSMYGRGLYTVYDLSGSQTEDGSYGPHIIKLKLNLYGYIIFDSDVALKVYKAPLSIVEQAQEVGADEEVIKKLKRIKINRSAFTSDAAKEASKFLEGRVKGVVYTGSRDGRCALVYDPATAVPIAWKNVQDGSWTPVDRESIKPALRRSASGDWVEEKYSNSPFAILKRIAKLPIDKRVVSGNLNFSDEPLTSLPAGLQVSGDLDLSGTRVKSLPAGLKVGGTLNLYGTRVKSLPDDLQVGGNLYLAEVPIKSLPSGLRVGGVLELGGTSIKSLPSGLRVGGNLLLFGLPIKSLPEDLHVGGDLELSNTQVTSLPDNLHVGGDLHLNETLIKSLPSGLRIGGNLFLNNIIKSLPEDLQVDKRIFGFHGDDSSVPLHLKNIKNKVVR